MMKPQNTQNRKNYDSGVIYYNVDMGVSINVEEETWKELNKRKEPGDTFDDVVRRLLGDKKETKS